MKLFLIILATTIVVIVVLGVGALLKMRRDYARSNLIVPGVATAAPASWASIHTPEARLHRRLRDLVRTARKIPGLDALAPSTQGEVERCALALDQRLVAAATAPQDMRAPALDRITAQVDALESAVSDLLSHVAAGPGTPQVAAAARALAERAAALDDARNEVNALDAGLPPSTAPNAGTPPSAPQP